MARTYREAVAEEFRVAMARRGLSQSALARLMRTNQAWVSVRARGEVPINVDDLERLAEALELDPVDLLPKEWVKPSPPAPDG